MSAKYWLCGRTSASSLLTQAKFFNAENAEFSYLGDLSVPGVEWVSLAGFQMVIPMRKSGWRKISDLGFGSVDVDIRICRISSGRYARRTEATPSNRETRLRISGKPA